MCLFCLLTATSKDVSSQCLLQFLFHFHAICLPHVSPPHIVDIWSILCVCARARLYHKIRNCDYDNGMLNAKFLFWFTLGLIKQKTNNSNIHKPNASTIKNTFAFNFGKGIEKNQINKKKSMKDWTGCARTANAEKIGWPLHACQMLRARHFSYYVHCARCSLVLWIS